MMGSTRTLVLITILVIAFLIGGWLLFLQWRLVWSRTSQQHSYQLHDRPAFLTEAVALDCAKATLTAEGYDLSEWTIIEDGGRAPDGTKEYYLRRDADLKHGVLHFRRTKGDYSFELHVHVNVEGDVVNCIIVQLK